MSKQPEKKFVDQSASDIRYYLLDKPVDETQFTVLEQSTHQWGSYEVTLKILGESHMITISNGKDFLQEICACMDVTVGNIEPITASRLLQHTQPIKYQTSALEYISSAIFDKISTDINVLSPLLSSIENSNTLTIHHVFATSPIASTSEPITLVQLEHGDVLSIQTIHTYPNEDLFVITKTLVKNIDNT